MQPHAESGVPFVTEAMFVLARAVVYATVFVGLLLVFVPAQLLSWAGFRVPPPSARRRSRP
jgi:hypothetical protein